VPPQFDYVVANDDLESACARVQAIITAEKSRVSPRRAEI